MTQPIISLIIPAYNEEKYIVKTLESVLQAKENFREPAAIEIIVVNNCSTDNTEKIAQDFAAKVIFEEKRCIASVRNAGAKIAEGKILGFLDADNWITPNMFNSIDAAMSSGKYIGGGTRAKLERSSLGLFCTYCITAIPARWFLGIMGGLFFTEKETFEALGGFDESLYCAEDVNFALALKRYGKPKGKKFKIITDDYIIVSTRSFDRFGDWYYFTNIPKVLLKGGLKAFKDKNIVGKFWYDIKR
jgi:hypothetical protein